MAPKMGWGCDLGVVMVVVGRMDCAELVVGSNLVVVEMDLAVGLDGMAGELLRLSLLLLHRLNHPSNHSY